MAGHRLHRAHAHAPPHPADEDGAHLRRRARARLAPKLLGLRLGSHAQQGVHIGGRFAVRPKDKSARAAERLQALQDGLCTCRAVAAVERAPLALVIMPYMQLTLMHGTTLFLTPTARVVAGGACVDRLDVEEMPVAAAPLLRAGGGALVLRRAPSLVRLIWVVMSGSATGDMHASGTKDGRFDQG